MACLNVEVFITVIIIIILIILTQHRLAFIYLNTSDVLITFLKTTKHTH